MYFDELDKISDTARGQEIANLLIHLTDPGQNEAFVDKYFHGVEIDLSRALFIFSYNQPESVNPILRDRMVTIPLQGYRPEDKLAIARKHLIPAVLREHGMEPDSVVFGDQVLREVLERAPAEEGVRNLRRAIEAIVGNINVLRFVPKDSQPRFVPSPEFRPFAVELPFEVQSKHLSFFLRPRDDVNPSLQLIYT